MGLSRGSLRDHQAPGVCARNPGASCFQARGARTPEGLPGPQAGKDTKDANSPGASKRGPRGIPAGHRRRAGINDKYNKYATSPPTHAQDAGRCGRPRASSSRSRPPSCLSEFAEDRLHQR